MLNNSPALDDGARTRGKEVEIGLPSPFPTRRNPDSSSNQASSIFREALTWEWIATWKIVKRSASQTFNMDNLINVKLSGKRCSD